MCHHLHGDFYDTGNIIKTFDLVLSSRSKKRYKKSYVKYKALDLIGMLLCS